jgi:hypothetical protein
LGVRSTGLLLVWGLKYLYEIFDQSYYLTATLGSSILAIIAFLGAITAAVELLFYFKYVYDQLFTSQHSSFLKQLYFCLLTDVIGFLMLFDILPIRLWHALIISVALEGFMVNERSKINNK